MAGNVYDDHGDRIVARQLHTPPTAADWRVGTWRGGGQGPQDRYLLVPPGSRARRWRGSPRGGGPWLVDPDDGSGPGRHRLTPVPLSATMRARLERAILADARERMVAHVATAPGGAALLRDAPLPAPSLDGWTVYR
jgi:hypothetical protein